MATIDDLKATLIGQLTPYLKKTDKTFDEELLSVIVDGVLMDAQQLRRYPLSYSDEAITRDMSSALGIFRNVALSRWNKIGVENESSHTEGEVSRKFVDAEKEWSGWYPLAVTL